MFLLMGKSGGISQVALFFVVLSAVILSYSQLLSVYITEETAIKISGSAENHVTEMNVKKSPPGIPIKYVEFLANGVPFEWTDITIQYTDKELKGLNENTLAIFSYDSDAQTWSELPSWIDEERNILRAKVHTPSIFAVSAKIPDIPAIIISAADTNKPTVAINAAINIHDTTGSTVTGYIRTYDSNKTLKKQAKASMLLGGDISDNGELEVDALDSKNLAVNMRVKGPSWGKIILDDYGMKNPVSVPVQGFPVKFVEIGAINIDYSQVDITIHYTDAELNGADENSLVIYHWNSSSWEALATQIDPVNNLLRATAISLSPFAVSATGGVSIIRVSTSRYSVFAPYNTANQINFNEDNSSFTFTAGALVIDANGSPLADTDVNFNIFSGDGTLKQSGTIATNKNGIAFFPYNTFRDFTSFTDSDYGLWTIRAEMAGNPGINGIANINISSTGGASGTGTCGNMEICHHNPASLAQILNTSPRSPYSDNFGKASTTSMAFGAHIRRGGLHGITNSSRCALCHVGLDRDPAGPVNAPWGMHKNIDCRTCHNTTATTWPIPIPGCYDAGCHPRSNNNLTNISTLATIDGITNVSIYSTTNGSVVIPFSVHNGSQRSSTTGVPCWICHGPMHNITKPDPLPSNTNNITEDSQCTSCHNAYQRHNNSVNCTVCHSQDAHIIKVFSQDATYINGSTSPFRGNCTNCHQNPSFLSDLLSQFMAGSYPGRESPQIQKPLNHSDDVNAGRKWNQTPGYWTNGTDGAVQLTSCIYCHGRTLHNVTALGRPSLFKGNNTVNSTITAGTNWCASCHEQGYSSGTNTYDDMVNTYNFPLEPLLVPPEITGNPDFGADQSSPSYFNHSTLTKDDASCRECHGSLATGPEITGFMHNVAVGSSGGPNCTECHDINGVGAPADKRVDSSAMGQGVHGSLNAGVPNISAVDPVNKACWMCHGEGTEPEVHPQRYKTPRRCSSNDCHSLSQTIKEPMVYSHFREANLNSNPANATNYNVTTDTSCETCHSISLTAGVDNFNASVSHYASKANLIDSINCIYCHLNEDNSIKWGNATEINKNRSSLVEMDREKNKFTARNGEFLDLGQGYRLRVTDVSILRGNAFIELYKVNTLLDIGLINIPGRYVYEEDRVINNSTVRIPVIVLNITELFVSGNEGFIQFEGFRIKRLHYENQTTSCYMCHYYGVAEKHRYTVIDRRDEYVYYTEVLFNSSDNKGYDQQRALQILDDATPEDDHISFEIPGRKTILKGEKWELAKNFNLTLEDISENSDTAVFLLEAGGQSHTDVVGRGKILDYEPGINYLGYAYTNLTIFRANVSEISQPNIVVLEDIFAMSPEVNKIKENDSIYGYNTSWIWENDTFLTGRIPDGLHAPLLNDGNDGGANCVSCHDAGELGAHRDVNKEVSGSASRACWACHGEGNEPKWHPANYKTPRECKDCHVGRLFNATYIGDENHSTLPNCGICHVADTHRIIRFDVTPAISSLSLSREVAYAGEKITISATATAGYEMRIRGAEYYVDSPSTAVPMHALDGSFDEQREEVTAELDTSGLEPGSHTVYVRAMERNNKWGEAALITFELKEKEFLTREDEIQQVFVTSLWVILGAVLFIAVIIFLKYRKI